MIEIENVFSAFDGCSGGQLALNKANIKYKNYYASEIDKPAIRVTQKNFPNTIQLGDITKIKTEDLPDIDLLMGGSPCQNLSLAGNRKGLSTKCNIEVTSLEQYLQLKEEGFEFEGQSYLFWEFIRILKAKKPRYFLLENVKIDKKWKQVFNEAVGCEPIMINSNKLSAQNRQRNYWTNIPNITQPEDKGIFLKDIVEYGTPLTDKSQTILSTIYKENAKSMIKRKKKGLLVEGVKFIPVEKHNSDNGLICVGGVASEKSKLWLDDGKLLQRNFSQGNRVYHENDKTCTINSNSGGLGGKTGLYLIKNELRKLSPLECERLQTVPDDYTDCVSDTQRYKMLGNGWTVDIIAHIFSFIK